MSDLRNLYWTQGPKDYSMLSSRTFTVFTLTFRPIIHYELIFAYDVRV